jgi:hypothetical protein
MIDYLNEDVRSEIRRADHMLYVSLKYARTGDVIRNIIKRLINTFELGVANFLESYKEKGKIKEVPKLCFKRVELIEKILKNKIKKYLRLYKILKFIDKAKITCREEYRKNVTLVASENKKKIEVNYETLKRYFEETKEFINFLNGLK